MGLRPDQLNEHMHAGLERIQTAWRMFNQEMFGFNQCLSDGAYDEAEAHRVKASAYFEAACDESTTTRRFMDGYLG